MGVDKIDSVGLPVEERSGLSGNRDVFDLRNLGSSLPTTNTYSERTSVRFQSRERSVLKKREYRKRILKAKVDLAMFFAKTKKLEEFTAPHRSAILGITSPYPKEEENMVSALDRLALSDKPENKQELNITSLRITAHGNAINSKLRSERTREERLKAHKERRLSRVCLSRGLSMEDIKSETKESSMKELFEKLRRFREEYEESVKLMRACRHNAV